MADIHNIAGESTGPDIPPAAAVGQLDTSTTQSNDNKESTLTDEATHQGEAMETDKIRKDGEGSEPAKDTDKYDRDKDRREIRRSGPQREVCRNFLYKHCTRGALCKFRHPNPERSFSSQDSSRQRSRSPVPTSESQHSDGVICRDYLRNMCNRGDECRFRHPPPEEVEKKSWFTLCLDFMGGRCSRNDCRFFHVTPEDEAHFRKTGEISLHVVDQAMRKALVLDVTLSGTRPTCKDFLKGVCRLETCRFRHMSCREYQDEVYRAVQEEFEKILGVQSKKPPPNNLPLSQSVYNWSAANVHQSSSDYMPSGSAWDDRQSTDRLNYPFMPKDSYGMKWSLEQEVGQLRSEVSRILGENVKLRSGPDHDSVTKEALDKLMTTNEKFMQDNKKLQETIWRLEYDNNTLKKDAEEKEKKIRENVSSLERRCETMKIELDRVDEIRRNCSQLQKCNDFLIEKIRSTEVEVHRLESDVAQKWGNTALSTHPNWVAIKSLISDATQKASSGFNTSSYDQYSGEASSHEGGYNFDYGQKPPDSGPDGTGDSFWARGGLGSGRGRLTSPRY